MQLTGAGVAAAVGADQLRRGAAKLTQLLVGAGGKNNSFAGFVGSTLLLGKRLLSTKAAFSDLFREKFNLDLACGKCDAEEGFR